MRDPLKEYVDHHRTELDVAVPPEQLWTNIENAMIVALPAAGISSGIPWLKYFAFGLSAVAATAVVYTALNSSAPEQAAFSHTAFAPAAPIENVFVTPEDVAASQIQVPATKFILMNTAAELPPPAEPEPAVVFTATPADTLPAPVETQAAQTVVLVNDSIFTGIKRVELISTSTSVTVKGTNESTVSVAHDGNDSANLKLEYTRTDTLLRIRAKVDCGKPKITRSRKGFSFKSCTTASPAITLLVPAGTSVVVQNTYGDTKVSAVSGPVCEVRSSSGDVTLAAVNATTNVITSYGDLDAREITGNLTAHLSSGSAVVQNVTGDVELVSTYGNQSLSGITGNIRSNGSSGDISITKHRGNLSANTSYGSIHIHDFVGSAQLISSSGSIVGESVELTANSSFATTYGDVNVTLVNPLQSLSFDLATTYGSILIDKNGEQFQNKSKLSLTRGNILIKATSSSGDQVFR